MPRIRGRRAELADRYDDAQPRIGAIFIALATHRLDHLARLHRGLIAMELEPKMRLSLNLEVRKRHGPTILLVDNGREQLLSLLTVRVIVGVARFVALNQSIAVTVCVLAPSLSSDCVTLRPTS